MPSAAPWRSLVDPIRNLVDAGEEASLTVDLHGWPVRLLDRRGIKPSEFRPADDRDLRAGRRGQADPNVGPYQQATGPRGRIFLLRLAKQHSGANGEQVGGKRFIVDRVTGGFAKGI